MLIRFCVGGVSFGDYKHRTPDEVQARDSFLRRRSSYRAEIGLRFNRQGESLEPVKRATANAFNQHIDRRWC